MPEALSFQETKSKDHCYGCGPHNVKGFLLKSCRDMGGVDGHGGRGLRIGAGVDRRASCRDAQAL